MPVILNLRREITRPFLKVSIETVPVRLKKNTVLFSKIRKQLPG